MTEDRINVTDVVIHVQFCFCLWRTKFNFHKESNRVTKSLVKEQKIIVELHDNINSWLKCKKHWTWIFKNSNRTWKLKRPVIRRSRNLVEKNTLWSLIKVNDVRNKSARSDGRLLININEEAAETLRISRRFIFSYCWSWSN